MFKEILGNLVDVQLNYLAILLAALAYFILAIMWYSPQVFGQQLVKHEVINPQRMPSKILAYILEFVVNLIMAFVLAIVIEWARAGSAKEGLLIAFWMWLGFVATTHFCDVIWGRKSFISYFLNGGLVLVGLLVMGAIIPAVRDQFPLYTF